MKTLKLAILPVALLATSAFAHNHDVAESATYNAENGIIKNTTNQLVEGTKTFFNKATKPAVISAEVGTLGYGGHIAWGVSPKTDLVAGWNGGEIDFDVDIGGDDSIINWKKVLGDNMKDYEANLAFKADLNNPYLGVKLRPWSNSFNIGTGVIFNDNQYSAKLTNEKEVKYKIKGTNEEVSVTPHASIEVSAEQRNSVSPYLTLGFQPSMKKRWGFFGEVGVAYTGDLKTNVTYDVPEEAKDTNLETDVKKVAEDIQKEVNDSNLEWQPIVKAGVTFRF